MTSKQRLAQAERIARNAKDTKRMTWKDFIDWINGKVFDAVTEAKLQKEWGKFIADKDVTNE